MTNLNEQKCVPCSIGAEPLNHVEIENYIKSLKEGWENLDDTKIKKTFKFKDFVGALEFTNAVGEISEEEGHHPNICLGWGYVTIELYTHKIKGLHLNDFILASKIEEI